MAEARMAVEPMTMLGARSEVDTSVHVTQMHFSDAGFVLYIPHPKHLVRSARRTIWQSWRKVQVVFMPLPPWLIITFVSGVTTWVLRSNRGSWQRSGKLATLLWNLDSLNPFTKHFSTEFRVGYLAGWVATGAMIAVTAVQRATTRVLLSYHGWLDHHGRKSLTTKVWGALLKYVYIRKVPDNTYGFQGVLPNLPLPNLNTTVERYMKSVKPILSEEEYSKLQHLSHLFLENEGPRLNRWLKLKWLTSRNYISDWWLDLIYLRGRDSIAINSNWYGILFGTYFPTHNQVARAAVFTHNLVKCKQDLDNERLPPQAINGFVPLCMSQFEKVFSCTRVPGPEQDALVVYEKDESNYVLVIHKGRFFKLPVFDSRQRVLTPLQLALAIQGIVESTDPTEPNEARIPALTAWNRTKWWEARDKHFIRHKQNSKALEVVEKALFVLCLDDGPAPANYSEEGLQYMVGSGTNRWYDKSFNLVVTSNAKVGVNVEHAWGDAPTLACVLELCGGKEAHRYQYTDDGWVKPQEWETRVGVNNVPVLPAERIRFHVSKDLNLTLDEAVKDHMAQINDFDLYVEKFGEYGKGIVKKVNCSPDAWIQMALQIAYYRDQGKFSQTYESSMTRLFLDGRTETIRSCSEESCAFVRALEDPHKTCDEKVALLKVACDQHQRYSHLAMTGQAVDRHLFGLYVVSIGKKIESQFLREALGRGWKLSTSQVPVRQNPKGTFPDKDVGFDSPNGGFGPVADDGYGVSYCIHGENMFYFNVSSKKSAPNTDSARMHARICQALRDMKQLADSLQHDEKGNCIVHHHKHERAHDGKHHGSRTNLADAK